MRTLLGASRPVLIALAATVFGVTAFAQRPGPGQDLANLPPPDPKGTATTEPAQQAVLSLFNKYEVVGMDAAHGAKDIDNFILALVRNPEFSDKVNDIAVECGNSLYQPILDRYIAGEDVPVSEVRKVWGNTTQIMCSLSGFYPQLFSLVRQINQKLPPGKKLRVLGGDPPVDWSRSQEDRRQVGSRDQSIASVMEKEVLSRHRKALMLFGTGHLFHDGRSAVGTYEKDYPNVTFIITDHHGFGLLTPLAKYNDELERRLASWPVPSLAIIKGSWLDDLDFAYFFPAGTPASRKTSEMADGYLYLGPRDLLLFEHIPASIARDQDYLAELRLRYSETGLERELGTVESKHLELLSQALEILSAGQNGPPKRP